MPLVLQNLSEYCRSLTAMVDYGERLRSHLIPTTGIVQKIVEFSEFKKIKGQWFYVDGKHSAKSMDSVYNE